MDQPEGIIHVLVDGTAIRSENEQVELAADQRPGQVMTAPESLLELSDNRAHADGGRVLGRHVVWYSAGARRWARQKRVPPW